MSRRNFSHIKTHTVRGRRFLIRWRRPMPCPSKGEQSGDLDGHCDAPCTSGRAIYLHKGGDAINLVGTVGHELLHAANFDLSEDLVDEWEESFTKMLRRMKAKIIFE